MYVVSKIHLQSSLDMNHRHHMAQLAARSSVEFYTHLFFRDATTTKTGTDGKSSKRMVLQEEEAYIIKMVKNGFAALIPKYGIEGLVFLDKSSSGVKEEDGGLSSAVPRDWLLSHDPESNCIVSALDPGYRLGIFQKIKVSLCPIDEKDAQATLSRRQLKFSLTWPAPKKNQ